MVDSKLFVDFNDDYISKNRKKYKFVKYGYTYNDKNFLKYRCIYLNDKELTHDVKLFLKNGLILVAYAIPPFICHRLKDDFNEIAEEIGSNCRILQTTTFQHPFIQFKNIFQ